MTSLAEMMDYVRWRQEGHLPLENDALLEEMDVRLRERIQEVTDTCFAQQQAMEAQMACLTAKIAVFDPLTEARTQAADLQASVVEYRALQEDLYQKGEQASAALSDEQKRKEGLLLELTRLRAQLHQTPPNHLDEALCEGTRKAALWMSKSMAGGR